MVDEIKYSIPFAERSPLDPAVTTLYVWQRNGNLRFPINKLEDKVVEPGNSWGSPIGDRVWTWSNFRAMMEAEYEMNLQDTIDANPIGESEPNAAWWTRVTNIWLAPYFAAHNYPQNLLDGWESVTGDYTAPYDEPIGGLLPLEE